MSFFFNLAVSPEDIFLFSFYLTIFHFTQLFKVAMGSWISLSWIYEKDNKLQEINYHKTGKQANKQNLDIIFFFDWADIIGILYFKDKQ